MTVLTDYNHQLTRARRNFWLCCQKIDELDGAATPRLASTWRNKADALRSAILRAENLHQLRETETAIQLLAKENTP